MFIRLWIKHTTFDRMLYLIEGCRGQIAIAPKKDLYSVSSDFIEESQFTEY